MRLDDATELMAQLEWTFRNNPMKLKEIRKFYLAFCAVLNQKIEADRTCVYRVN